MPLYLFWGDEDYNVEAEINCLKKTVLQNDINALNYRVLDNPPFAEFDEALRSQPMMFGEVLYIIKTNKYFMESGKKFSLDDKQTEEIIKSLENVPVGLHIVLLCQSSREDKKKPDSRKKLYKAVAKYGTIKGFEAFKPWEGYKVTPWIKERAREKGLEMNPQVISTLIQNTGVSLRDLDNQLEKLKLIAHPKKTVTEQMAEDLCSGGEDIFTLCDLVLQKDYTKALCEISKLLEKSHYLEMLAFLQSAFLKLLQTKLYSSKMNGFELSKKLGQHEFVIKKNLEKLKNVPLEELVRLKLNLTDAEFKLKSGEVTDAFLALEVAFLSERKAS